ncbi:MAG TPA: hypothetical protein VII99_09635, partial [Bacteroidia bacterium]
MKFFFTVIFFIPALFHVHSQGIWTQKANFAGTGRTLGTGFSIWTKGYLGTGWDVTFKKDFWEYDRITNVWTQKANFGGVPRNQAVGFSIGTKGYIGTGNISAYGSINDFWEYDPSTNIWTQKANVPGQMRNAAIGFSIGSKGYIGGGNYYASNYWHNLNDFWEYDPVSNIWTQKANLPGPVRQLGIGFSISNKGYIGTGADSSGYIYYQDIWEWDQVTNFWTQKANFPGGKRWGAYGFSIGNYGYVGMGDSTYNIGSHINDLWQFFPFTNTWKQVASYPGGTRSGPVGFSIGCQGFFGTGFDTTYNGTNDFWEYIPDTLTAAVSVGNGTICSGDSTSLYAFGGIHFLWSTGDTTPFITVHPTVITTYSVLVSDNCGSNSATTTILVNPSPSSFFN